MLLSTRAYHTPQHTSLHGDCRALGLSWGFLLAAADFRQYLLYAVLCLLAAMDPAAMGTLFAQWAARNSLVALTWELLLSGWITDALRPSQHQLSLKLLPILSAIGLAIAVLLLLRSTNAIAVVVAEALYHFSTVAQTQATTSLWKVLKTRIAYHNSKDIKSQCSNSDREMVASSLVSAIGDVVAEVSETLLLAISASFTYYRPASMTSVVFGCMAVLLFLSVISSWKTISLISVHSSESTHESPTPTTAISEPPTTATATKQRFVPEWLVSIAANPPLLHSFAHAQIGLLLYGLLGSPLVIALATANKSITPMTTTTEALVSRSCPTVVADLLSQGSVINVTFLLGAMLYSATLLHRAPRAYYGLVLLVITGLTLLAALTVPIAAHLAWSFPRMMLVSACQVVVYHLNTYDYSVLTACTPEQHYGWIMAAYAAASNLLHLVNSFLLWTQAPLSVIIAICTSLLATSAMYGFWMRRLFVRQDWSH